MLVVFLGEVLLRVNPEFRKEKKYAEWMRTMFMYDRLLGWKLIPNAELSSESFEYNVRYCINSKGLRDKECSYNKNMGQFRILCIGDSVTFGWGVDSTDRFTDILERYFNDVQIINMGIPGFGIDQELLFLKHEGIKFHPDLVLVYTIPHDLERACHSRMYNRPKPQFKLNNDQLYLTNTPVPRVDVFSFLSPNISQIKYYLAKKSYVCYFLSKAFMHLSLQNIHQKSQTNKAALAKAIFRDMQNIAQKFNFKLVIFGNLPQDIQDSLRKNDIYFCKDHLTPLKNNIDNFHFIELSYSHPNILGHKLIAEGIYNFLVENELIPKEHLLKK